MWYSSIRPSHTATPRHASHRIASSAACRPPASIRLGKRWTEFQGANNWDNLLDPLDPTLRSEILRYGSFVQATYSSCDLDTSSPSYASCRFPKHSLLRLSGLPFSGYRVTRNLHATSGSRLPHWAPASLSRQTSWIGFIAVCDDEAELARLGRRDIVIALRGTVTALEWLDNLRATLTHPTPSCTPTDHDPARTDPMVQRGFWSLFTSSSAAHRSLCDQVRDEIRRLLHQYSCDEMSITITGHSLGAALAVLTANDLSTMLGPSGPMVTVVSFAGPRVGNASFRRRMEEQGSKVLRIVNTSDIITKVPGFVDERDKEKMVLNWLISKSGWVYADIGRELRVSGRRTANVAVCHDLSHYLQLVNQLSEVCPLVSQVERLPRGWRGAGILAGDAL
ncbi:phospholipase A(1) DAD1, chloroplastic [Dendrobium catenatum]|uniref:Phospholipase A(1) DAD1, chloroplastic n=1 Tax=Dendrobium catenatum TaxID=906689 RepID=A0A2I0W993_9ASPA|nr:phospholipase A(1) DAD1, chloroplastic [Dendrobium catenatum]PKU72224.1 Phospholipase A(1) DAD1, chloroplastic [Dendrobium catenatum]